MQQRQINIFKNIRDYFPNSEKEMCIQVQEVYRTPSQGQKRNSPQYMQVRRLKIQNKERAINNERKKIKSFVNEEQSHSYTKTNTFALKFCD